jgi:hypothetical protein
LLQRD